MARGMGKIRKVKDEAENGEGGIDRAREMEMEKVEIEEEEE